MKRIITALTVVGICLLFAAPASSQEDGYARSGAYLGVGVVGASLVRLDQLATGVDADETAGFKVIGGYRVSSGVAFEGQFEMLPAVVTGLGKRGELEIMTVTGNMKMFVLTGRFQPYALVGLGGMRREFDNATQLGLGGRESSFVFRFGAGLDFYITQNIVASAGAGYVLPTGTSLDDFDYVSYGGGIQYRF